MDVRQIGATAAYVREAFERFATGAHSYRDVADYFNAAGLRTRHRAPRANPDDGPRLWSGDSVRKLIQSPVYVGKVFYKGDALPGRHEPIVSAELWTRANRIGQRLKGTATTYTQKRFYPLSGILKCAGCGSALQGNHTDSGKAYRYYREVAHRRGVECPQPQIAVRADRVEAMVDAIVKRFTAPKQLRARVEELLSENATDEDPIVRVTKLKERLRRIVRLYADLEMDEANYQAQRRKIEAEIDRLEVPKEKAREAIKDFDVLQLAWKKATPVEKRSLGLALFEAIYFSLETMDITEAVVSPAFRPWIS